MVRAGTPGHAHDDTSQRDQRPSEQLTSISLDTPRHTDQACMNTALLPQQHKYHHPFPFWKRCYMIGILAVNAALLYADQTLLAPNLTAAAREFGFDDKQKDVYLGGYLMAAFFIVGAPSALLVGWLAPKCDRRILLFAVVWMGQAPCVLTYWAHTYWQFFLLRTMTGISVGGCFPLVYSFLGDLVPINRRSLVAAAVAIAGGVGIASGQGISSSVGQAFSWRLPFVIIGTPAVVVALLILLTTDDPPRGGCEQAIEGQLSEGMEYNEEITWHKVKLLFRQTSNWLIVLQGLPGSLPWGMMLTYFNDYLSYDRGLSMDKATTVILFFGFGAAAGTITGGALGQLLYNRRKEYLPVLMGTAALTGMIPLYCIINMDIAHIGITSVCALSFTAGFVASMPLANLRASILNVNEPELRGVAVAMQAMTDDVGKGLGPFIVAFFIQYMGRKDAFNLAVAGWGPCGLMMLALCFTLRRDEEAMQTRLAGNMLTRVHEAHAQQLGLTGVMCKSDVGEDVAKGWSYDDVMKPQRDAGWQQKEVLLASMQGGGRGRGVPSA